MQTTRKIFKGKKRNRRKNKSKSLCGKLKRSNTQKAILTHVSEEDKTTTLIQGIGSNYKSKAIAISEFGIYDLVFSSKMSQAKQFKRWVTSEVLPTIRKTGSYSNVPQSFAQALRLAADLEEIG
ncbi:hypothetical protein CQR42_10070 [Enterococcus faecium]|nr:hypothetical protein CQR42_10070 [Enterococcus faecium]